MAYRGAPRRKKEASEKGQHFPFRVKKRLVDSYNTMGLVQKRIIKREVRTAFAKSILKLSTEEQRQKALEIQQAWEQYQQEEQHGIEQVFGSHHKEPVEA